MPFKLSLILAKNSNMLKAEQEFFIEREREFATKYLQTDETGQFVMEGENIFKIKPGMEKECQEARNELNQFTTDIQLREIPLSLVENMEFKKDKCYINACIVVDRDNLKGIIIGKNGQMLKKIGSMAREEIEVLLGKKVYLELFVKVIDNWRQKPNLFQELGISEEDD